MASLHPNPLSRQYLTGVIQERPDHTAWRAQYIGPSLLPMKQVPAYRLTWDVVKTRNNLAGFYAINGRPIPGSEMLFETRYQEVKNIMASRVIHPEDVMILREPGEVAVSRVASNMRAAAQEKVRKNIAECDDEVDATVEYMIMQALQGQIVWPPKDADGNAITPGMASWGDVTITINFPLRSTFNQAASTLSGYGSRTGGGAAWTDETNSDPIKDLEVIAELISETIGVDAHGSRIIMGAGLLSRLGFNDSIISWVKGTEKGTRFVAVAEFQEFIRTKIGYTIQPYAAKWTYDSNLDAAGGPTVTSVPFLGRNKMIIVPPGVKIGYFAVAPSPDGAYNSSKYTWSVTDKEPPFETRVGEGLVGFPVCDHISDIFVFDAGS